MSHLVRFGSFEVDLSAGRLLKHGVRIGLRDQSFQVLVSLLEHPGEVVTRDDLCRRLWRDEVFVDFDNNLNTAVARLREALGDASERPRFIETLPKRGYRFIAEVAQVSSEATEAQPRRARLVVLPFVNLSGDPAQEYFSDAMTDEIITALASVAPEQLAVIARTTAMHYKGTHKDVGRIGHELNVDYAVEGGVLRWDNQVAINVQLVQTSDQAHLFARKYDADMADVFSLYNCIARALAGHVPAVTNRMRDGATRAEQAGRKPTEDLAAYTEYIKGRQEMWKMTPPGLAKAKQHFEAALARDPGFALAYCGVAQLYWYLGFGGFAPSKETDPIGRFYALRAIEIDPTLAEAHALLSYYPKQRQYNEPLGYYDWGASLKDVVRARELNPRSQLVQIRYAIVLMVLGRLEEAVAELEPALDSDPLSFEVRIWLVEILGLGRHYDQALAHAQRLVELEPEHFMSYWLLGMAYMAVQSYADSVARLHKAVELSGGSPLMLGWLGLALGLGGQQAEARAVLENLHGLARQRYVPPTCFAWTHLGLGEIDEAFVWMDRAVEAPDRMMSPIKTYPFFDPLRADPRFAALLRKMNLEQ